MGGMTCRERMQAAMALQPVDRVPVMPKFDLFPFRYQGLKLADVVRDADLYREAVERTEDDLGPCDGVYLPSQVVSELGFFFMGTGAKLPGYELGDDEIWQMDEKEVMSLEDYDFIAENGWSAYLRKIYPRLGYRIPADRLTARLEEAAQQQVKDILKWEERGIPPVYGGAGYTPAFEALSYTRSLKTCLMDLRRHPDRVLAAIEVIEAESVANALAGAERLRSSTRQGFMAMTVGFSRSCFLRLDYFEKFVWPYLKKAVETFIAHGITPNLHCDGDWTRHLQYLVQLPPGKVVLDLDGSTDIVKAKELLRGRMCIMGDVPPSLLSLGSAEDVARHCRHLIDVVGADNGFILSSGCSVPLDAKPENVRVLIETAKTYYPHRNGA
jgi:hypothetical protein